MADSTAGLPQDVSVKWTYLTPCQIAIRFLEKGVTKGGSWKDTGYYLNIHVEEPYDSTSFTSSERGFRFVMKVIK